MGKDHFCQDSMRPRARPGQIENSRAAAVGLHLQGQAPADLYRQPAQLRIQEVGVLA